MPARMLSCGLAAVALLGAACTSVPTRGEATEVGDAPREGAVRDNVDTARRAAARVREGAGPADVVDGFLSAQADTSPDGIDILQEYLVAPDDWNAGQETIVYDDKQVAIRDSVSETVRRVRVTYSVVARIDADGEYRPGVESFEETFEVSKVSPGWRISGAPIGRRVSRSDLTQVFNRVVPYFYSDSDYDTLVPHPIYQLNDGTELRSLVERLIQGPSPALDRYFPESLFPPGTTILAVTETDNSIAELTFSTELQSTTAEKRRKLVAQLVWTLTAMDFRITAVTAVTVIVGDRPIDIGDLGTADAIRQNQFTALDPDASYTDRAAYFNLAGTLGQYTTSNSIVRERLLTPGAGQPAVDPSDKALAIAAQAEKLHELRVMPVAAGEPVTHLKFDHMTKPSWGTAEDGVWVVGQTTGEVPAVYTVPLGAGDLKKVGAPDLDSKVLSFEVAPDGLRVAAIVERGGRGWLEIGYIDRPSFTREARAVGGFRTVVDGNAFSAAAAVWVDSGKLAFVGAAGQDDPEVFTVLVDGTDLQPVDSGTLRPSRDILRSSESTGSLPVQLVALPSGNDSAGRGSNTPTALMLVVDTERVHVNTGLGWTQVATPPRSSPPTVAPSAAGSASPAASEPAQPAPPTATGSASPTVTVTASPASASPTPTASPTASPTAAASPTAPVSPSTDPP